MTPSRVGIDIVPIGRATALLDGDPVVLGRHLLAPELQEAHRNGALDVASVAGKLAGKEAVFKLLRRPGAALPWRSILITTEIGGWPVVALTTPAADWASEAGITGIDLSIAHDDGYAVAAAIAEVATAPGPGRGDPALDAARPGPPTLLHT